MNVRRGPTHAGFRVAVRVCGPRESPRFAASCMPVRPWCDRARSPSASGEDGRVRALALCRNQAGPCGKVAVMGPAFDAVVEAESPALHRYLRRRVGTAFADEVTAATFAAAYESWPRLDAERPVRPWLYGIAANLVRRHCRDERRLLRAYARTGADPEGVRR